MLETLPVARPGGAGRLGATPLGGGACRFRLWAPRARRVAVKLGGRGRRNIELQPHERGYHEAVVDEAPPGTTYQFVLDDEKTRPDPASRAQPEGVHGPSEVIDAHFEWTDAGWRNPPLAQHVIYELHAGTFTPEGTFDAIIPRLDDLRDLGITAVELMPIAQFPGTRNWGYDGVCLFAAQNSYGGIGGLRRLVNACHEKGLAVLLDVVYNHLGPEGNYLTDFGPYFTDRYHTPWGWALNFDGAWSDEVRAFFIANALHWVVDCHIDGLRLDAIHAIVDNSSVPFVEELTEAVQAEAKRLGRRILVIAESAANDARILRRAGEGGFGMDAQWNDDFHHALHVVLTGESGGYYCAFEGVEHLAKSMREGYVYTGEYSRYYRRRHGRSTAGIPPERFVAFAQNHDQVGNRMNGERLGALVDFERRKLAAATLLLSPFVPLLFMGEEYGERAPFLYFVSHGDEGLIGAVREGRREEFAAFEWEGEPPDPQAEETFIQSKLDWSRRSEPRHRSLLALHRSLLALRREHPALAVPPTVNYAVRTPREGVLLMHREAGDRAALIALNYGDDAISLPGIDAEGRWVRIFDSNEERWEGPGSQSPERWDSREELTLGGPSAIIYETAKGPASE